MDLLISKLIPPCNLAWRGSNKTISLSLKWCHLSSIANHVFHKSAVPMVFSLSFTLALYVFVIVTGCMFQFMGPVFLFSKLSKLLFQGLALGPFRVNSQDVVRPPFPIFLKFYSNCHYPIWWTSAKYEWNLSRNGMIIKRFSWGCLARGCKLFMFGHV